MSTWSKYAVMGESFELIDKYVVVDYLGSGAYGCVCAALELPFVVAGGLPADYAPENGVMVAIKKCKLIFQSRTLAKRTLREIRLLRHLSHPNIIDLKRVLMPRHAATFNDIYLVFEMCETDLASIIRSQQPLTDSHVKHFIMQLLQACEYLHQNCVVHRDIKPRNILVNGDCSLRLADFGLSRTHSKLQDSRTVAMTEYVTTRWYRAPEILVGWGQYGSGIDMWAVGCVLGELVGRLPIFPGGDSKTQLELIVNVLGRPSDAYIRNVRKVNCREALLALPASIEYVRKDIATVLDNLPIAGGSKRNANHDNVTVTPGASGVSPSALRLIDGLLVYDPAERLTALECLRSSYFNTSLSDSAAEKLLQNPCLTTVSPFLGPDFDFEHRKLSFDDLRSELLSEARWYEPHDSINEQDSQMEAYSLSANSCEQSLQRGEPIKSAEYSSDSLLSSSASVDAGEKKSDKYRFGMFCASWSDDKGTTHHSVTKTSADHAHTPESEASHAESRMCILL